MVGIYYQNTKRIAQYVRYVASTKKKTDGRCNQIHHGGRRGPTTIIVVTNRNNI